MFVGEARVEVGLNEVGREMGHVRVIVEDDKSVGLAIGAEHIEPYLNLCSAADVVGIPFVIDGVGH